MRRRLHLLSFVSSLVPALAAAATGLAVTACTVGTAESTTPNQSAKLIHAPADPGAPDSTSGETRTFAVRSLDLGASPAEAWKTVGLDIDGRATTSTSTGLCQLFEGSPNITHQSGDGGIDNSFAVNVMPIFLTVLGSDVPEHLDASFGAGSPFNLFDVRGLGTPASDATVLASFDGAPFTRAWVTGGTLVGAPSEARAVLLLGATPDIHGASNHELFVPITHVQMVAPLSDDGMSVAQGVLSGILPTEEAVRAFDAYANVYDPGIDAGLLRSLEDQVRQASDILVDGTQDPSRPCDGISFGAGFVADAHLAPFNPRRAPPRQAPPVGPAALAR